MDRLTVPRNENGPACVPDDDAISCYDEFGARDWIGPAIDRLAAYEDTGLTPAEVEAMKAERDAAKHDTTTVYREPIFDHGEQMQWSAYKCAKCGAWQPDHFLYCPGCGRMIVAKEDAQ